MDIATFRAAFPAFADTTKYPDAMVTLWMAEASSRLLPSVWGSRLAMGTMLLTAHLLSLASKAASTKGGSSTGGLVSSKALGPGSISFDNSIGTNAGAGSYNLTAYGVQFWEIAQLAGMGGRQLSPNPLAATPNVGSFYDDTLGGNTSGLGIFGYP